MRPVAKNATFVAKQARFEECLAVVRRVKLKQLYFTCFILKQGCSVISGENESVRTDDSGSVPQFP